MIIIKLWLWILILLNYFNTYSKTFKLIIQNYIKQKSNLIEETKLMY